MSFNSIYSKRGLPFSIEDYPENVQTLLRERILPVEDVVARFPAKMSFFSTLAIGQPRGLLRAMGRRTDWEEVRWLNALLLEPYCLIKNPNVHLVSGYMSALDRLVAHKMGKTVAYMPRQFCQYGEYLRTPGAIDYWIQTVTPPDENGFVNLGTAVDVCYDGIMHAHKTGQAKIIFEINPFMPWTNGPERHNRNLIHLSVADAVCVFQQPLTNIPPLEASEAEKKIAERVLTYIEDGDTLQLGIGGVPSYVASHLKDRRGLRIHSEMLTDAIVDLFEAGAIDTSGEEAIVGSFVGGTDRIYDFIDRNPVVTMLPIGDVNDPVKIAQKPNVKSINSTMMVDLYGQAASDSVAGKQVSGIGGQLEFVTGASWSKGGRAILCLKSTSDEGEPRSNIVGCFPRHTPVSVPRFCTDVIVTEHGAAELPHLDTVQRARALIAIADPRFHADLEEAARSMGVLERKPGFDSIVKRALFNNLPYVRKVMTRMEKEPERKTTILLEEVQKALTAPKPVERARKFWEENRA